MYVVNSLFSIIEWRLWKKKKMVVLNICFSRNNFVDIEY